MDRSGLVMPLIVCGALLIVPTVALIQNKSYDPKKAAAEAEDEQRRLAARNFLSVGFVPRAVVGPSRAEMWIAKHDVAWALANGEVTAEAPKDSDVTRIGTVLERELSRYSFDFLAQTKMSRVLVCASLREKDVAIPSLPNVDGAFLIDATLGDAFAARVIHHEIYHFVDLEEDGTLNHDVAWEALNPAGFAYGDGGRTMRAAWASEPSPAAPGFVTAYAVSAVAEDKAETFSKWMTAPDETLSLARSDGVVERKLRLLRGRLAK